MKNLCGLIILAVAASTVHAAVITSFTTSTFAGYAVSNSPGSGFDLDLEPQEYFTSDGSSWPSGAGSYYPNPVDIASVETSGNLIYFTLTPAREPLVEFTDFSYGDHSADGSFDAVGPLVLVAQAGTPNASISGLLLLDSNDPTYYTTFEYFAAAPGSLVQFTSTYTLTSGVWTTNTFNTEFDYHASGVVTFTPEPSSSALLAGGMAALFTIGISRRKSLRPAAGVQVPYAAELSGLSRPWPTGR